MWEPGRNDFPYSNFQSDSLQPGDSPRQLPRQLKQKPDSSPLPFEITTPCLADKLLYATPALVRQSCFGLSAYPEFRISWWIWSIDCQSLDRNKSEILQMLDEKNHNQFVSLLFRLKNTWIFVKNTSIFVRQQFKSNAVHLLVLLLLSKTTKQQIFGLREISIIY